MNSPTEERWKKPNVRALVQRRVGLRVEHHFGERRWSRDACFLFVVGSREVSGSDVASLIAFIRGLKLLYMAVRAEMEES